MPWCPRCKIEYLPHAKECSDCHIPLVDYDPNEHKPDRGEMLERVPEYLPHVFLTSVTDQYEGNQLLALLESQEIRFYPMPNSRSGHLRHYMGGLLMDLDIYVAEEDLERAKELVEMLRRQEDSEEPLDDGEEYKGMSPLWRLNYRHLVYGSLAVSAVSWLLVIILRLLL